MNNPDPRLNVTLVDPKGEHGKDDPEIVHLYQKAEKIYPREVSGRFNSPRYSGRNVVGSSFSSRPLRKS